MVRHSRHAVEQRCRKRCYAGVARCLALGVVTGRQQRLGQRLVFVQPVAAVPGVTGRLAIAFIIVDEVDIGRRRQVRLPALLQGAVDTREGLQHLAEAPAIENQMMGLGAEAVMLLIELDQEKAEQRLVEQRVGPGHLRLQQSLGRRLGVRLPRDVMLRHRYHHRLGKCLPGQAIGGHLQHRTQRVVLGHQLLNGPLDQCGIHRASKVDIAADVVQRRVAEAQLVQPDIPLGGGQGEKRHKILLM